jgi:hypothetical protein
MQVTISVDWTSGVLILLGSGVATGVIGELFKWTIARLGAPIDAYSQERAKIRAQLEQIGRRVDEQAEIARAMEAGKITAQLERIEERIKEQKRLTEEVEKVRIDLQDKQFRSRAKADVYVLVLQSVARLMASMSLALNEWDNRKVRGFVEAPGKSEEEAFEDYNRGMGELRDALARAAIVIGQEFYQSVLATMRTVRGISSDMRDADVIATQDLQTLKALMKRIRETASVDLGYGPTSEGASSQPISRAESV